MHIIIIQTRQYSIWYRYIKAWTFNLMTWEKVGVFLFRLVDVDGRGNSKFPSTRSIIIYILHQALVGYEKWKGNCNFVHVLNYPVRHLKTLRLHWNGNSNHISGRDWPAVGRFEIHQLTQFRPSTWQLKFISLYGFNELPSVSTHASRLMRIYIRYRSLNNANQNQLQCNNATLNLLSRLWPQNYWLIIIF